MGASETVHPVSDDLAPGCGMSGLTIVDGTRKLDLAHFPLRHEALM
jgi:hypothetical protein